VAELSSGKPHSPQNLWPGEFVDPHDEQIAASGLPQSPQNFCPVGFSAPQSAHMATPEA